MPISGRLQQRRFRTLADPRARRLCDALNRPSRPEYNYAGEGKRHGGAVTNFCEQFSPEKELVQATITATAVGFSRNLVPDMQTCEQWPARHEDQISIPA